MTPTPAERPVEDVLRDLELAAVTASNDDLSEPMTEKRSRHVARLNAIHEAAATIRRLEAEKAVLADRADYLGRKYADQVELTAAAEARVTELEGALAREAESLKVARELVENMVRYGIVSSEPHATYYVGENVVPTIMGHSSALRTKEGQ